MKVNAEKIEGNKAKLTVEVPNETFEKSMEKAFRQAVNKISIPGFRKGKAPRHVVEKMYGREIFLEDAINDAVPPAFTKALDEAGSDFECIVYPQYNVVSSEKGEGLVFTAVYDLKPPVKLGAYKGMELEKLSETPDEEGVAKELKAMQERFARLEKTEEAAVLGDVCTIDFVGKLDDVPFEGGTGADHPLELGSGSFIPGFEEQLVGAKAGDEVLVNVTFPEDYRATELAGKAVVFEVKVKTVQHKILSDLDDEFAKDVSEFDSIAELKQDLEEKLAKQAKDKSDADLESKAIAKVKAEAELELPLSMVELRQDQLLDNFARQIQRQGIGFEQYMELTGMSVEEVRANFLDRADDELRTELVLEAVAKAENLAPSEEDLEEEYKTLSEDTGRHLEEIKEIYGGNPTMVESLKFSLMMKKAIKFLIDNAKVIA